MRSTKPMPAKAALATIAVAFVLSTAVIGIGRLALDADVAADASRLAAADINLMPPLVLGVER